jgi:hypothetical protein
MVAYCVSMKTTLTGHADQSIVPNLVPKTGKALFL